MTNRDDALGELATLIIILSAAAALALIVQTGKHGWWIVEALWR